MQARKSACIFNGNQVRYKYFLYSLFTQGRRHPVINADSVESIFHGITAQNRAKYREEKN